MLKIRLQPRGKRKYRTYKFVVQESTKPRDADVLEILGHYNPHEDPLEINVDLKRVDHWLENGAVMTETAESLIKRARSGKFEDLKRRKKVSKHKKQKEEETAEEAEEEAGAAEKKENKPKKEKRADGEKQTERGKDAKEKPKKKKAK